MRTYKSNLMGCLTAVMVAVIGTNGWAAEAGRSGTEGSGASVVVMSANVMKLEGVGVARVRRSKGVESTLSVGAVVNPGDRVTTDSAATVELLLGDGTLIRVSPNSEYSYEGITRDKASGLSTWAFGLAKGGVRAVVEKGDSKKFVKFKINSPVGTMGVRGTHFLFLHDRDRGVSTLYTMEGEVMFGARGADYGSDALFRFVRGGFFSAIRKGEKMADEPRKFSTEDLITMIKAPAGGSAVAGLGELLLGEKKLSSLDSWSADELKKQLADVQAQFEKAQDLLGDVVQAQTDRREIGIDYSQVTGDLDNISKWQRAWDELEKKSKLGGADGTGAGRTLSELRSRGETPERAQQIKNALLKSAERLKNRFDSIKNPGIDQRAWGSLEDLAGRIEGSYSRGQVANDAYQAFASQFRRCTENRCTSERVCDNGFLGTGLFERCETRRICRQVEVQCPAPPSLAGAPPEIADYAGATPSSSGGAAVNAVENREGVTTSATNAPSSGSGGHDRRRDHDGQRGCKKYQPCSTPGCRTGTFTWEPDPSKCAIGNVDIGNGGRH